MGFYYRYGQWQHYTRARRVKWPGWKIYRPAYCFALVIVWTENKIFIICDADSFICFILASGWPGSRMFWPRNEPAPLLRRHHHWLWNHQAGTCGHELVNMWINISSVIIIVSSLINPVIFILLYDVLSALLTAKDQEQYDKSQQSSEGDTNRRQGCSPPGCVVYVTAVYHSAVHGHQRAMVWTDLGLDGIRRPAWVKDTAEYVQLQ